MYDFTPAQRLLIALGFDSDRMLLTIGGKRISHTKRGPGRQHQQFSDEHPVRKDKKSPERRYISFDAAHLLPAKRAAFEADRKAARAARRVTPSQQMAA